MLDSVAVEPSLSVAAPYFSSRGFVLYHGDCLDILAALPEASIDMIFADPPYNLSNGGFTVHAGRRVSVNKGKWDKSNGFDRDYSFHLQWISACQRVLKPGGTIWISGTYHSIYQCGHALQVASLDFAETDDLILEIKADYDLIRGKLIAQGFGSLTGRDGKWIQARTKGAGHGSTSRAFYARTALVKTIFEMANAAKLDERLAA